ncbi:hypothetical protein GGF46_003600 [Coemansia sp. RSA 552]|nr:hypothetical protein GGF46_003600 [Coemansia sp. RSA 552]
MYTYFIFVLFGLLGAAGGLVIPELAKRIINGFLMPNTMAPYAVSVRKQNGDTLYTCGGTIISPNYVLTAAHCLVGTTSNRQIPCTNITVGHGSMDNKDQEFVTSVRTVIHPQYLVKGQRNSAFDIGIIQVPTLPFGANTNKIPLFGGKVHPGQNLVAMGWGGTEKTAIMRNLLRGVIVATGDLARCQDYNRAFTSYKGPQVCTLGELTPDRSTCGGDSGSSVVINSQNRQALAGLNSVGVYKGANNSCGNADSAHFYVRPYYHIDFITKNTGLTKAQIVDNHTPTPTSSSAKDKENSGDAGYTKTVTTTIVITPNTNYNQQ